MKEFNDQLISYEDTSIKMHATRTQRKFILVSPVVFEHSSFIHPGSFMTILFLEFSYVFQNSFSVTFKT